MIDYKTAELIASRIQARKTKTGLFKRESHGVGQGFQLKTPYQMSRRKTREPDHVGTYTAEVTPEQIMVDWGHDE